MKLAFCILFLLALFAAFLPSLRAAVTFEPRPLSLAVNTGTGFPSAENSVNLLPTAAHAGNVLVKRGAAGYYDVCGANDEPIGLVVSPVLAADLGRKQAVYMLGSWRSQLPVVSGGATTLGGWLYTAANGQVQAEPSAAGTYWRVGRGHLAAGASGIQIPLEHTSPIKLVVMTEFTAVTTAAGSDAGTTQALANAIKADLTALRTAGATPTLFKFL